ncbi:MAG: hypothetical protein ACLPUO_02750 [Streptosporangiaceae bacterium]|jgi:hypothetical protein
MTLPTRRYRIVVFELTEDGSEVQATSKVITAPEPWSAITKWAEEMAVEDSL